MAYFDGTIHGWNDKDGYHHGKPHTKTFCDACAETAIPLPSKETWTGQPGGRHWGTGFKWAPVYGGKCDKCGKDC